MNAILFYSFANPMINGSLINAFEYYLAIYEHNRDFKLILLNTKEETRQLFISMIEERYQLDDLKGYEKNIVCFSLNDLIKRHFNKVLVVDYSTINKTKGLVNSDRIIVISDDRTTDLKYLYSKKVSHVIYCGEMPFQYKDVSYRMKMLFDRYKPVGSKKATYIHSPKNNDRSFINDINLPDQPVIFREPGHLKNLFSQFDTFVYYHAHTWFDPTPRLMHECYFYYKKIIYINNFELKDGSWFRFNDLLESGLTDRTLNINDPIVKEMSCR